MTEFPLQHLRKQRLYKPAPAPQQKLRLLVLPAWLLALLVSLAVLLGLAPGTRGAGTLGALMSVAGCVWEWNYWAKTWRAQQQIAESIRLRATQKTKRRARQAEQRGQRQHSKAQQAHTRQTQEQHKRRERQAQTERAAQETIRRSDRFAQVACEAERLLALEATAFRAEVTSLFAARGLNVQMEGDTETDKDAALLRFTPRPDYSLEIACFAADDAAIAVADVEALETARQQADASRAYLIGRAGFTPAAVRLAQRFPITFVEPQLLAQWKSTAETE